MIDDENDGQIILLPSIYHPLTLLAETIRERERERSCMHSDASSQEYGSWGCLVVVARSSISGGVVLEVSRGVKEVKLVYFVGLSCEW